MSDVQQESGPYFLAMDDPSKVAGWVGDLQKKDTIGCIGYFAKTVPTFDLDVSAASVQKWGNKEEERGRFKTQMKVDRAILAKLQKVEEIVVAEFQKKAKMKKGCEALASLDSSNLKEEWFSAKVDLHPSKYPAQVLKMDGGKAHLLPPSAANRLVPFCDMAAKGKRVRYNMQVTVQPSFISPAGGVSYTIKRMVVLDPTPDGQSQWARPSLLSSLPEFTGLGDLKTGASGGKYAPLDPPLVCATMAAPADAAESAVTVGYCSSETNWMAIKFDESDANLAALEAFFQQINSEVEERKKEFLGTKKFKKDQAPRVPVVQRSEEEVEKYGTHKTVFIKTVSQETANGYSTPTAFYLVKAPADSATATTDPKTLVDQGSAKLISMDQVGPGATVIPVAKLSKVDFPGPGKGYQFGYNFKADYVLVFETGDANPVSTNITIAGKSVDVCQADSSTVDRLAKLSNVEDGAAEELAEEGGDDNGEDGAVKAEEVNENGLSTDGD